MDPADFEHVALPQLTAPETGRVAIRWLGTAGYELRCEGTTVLVDPYLTRVGIGRLLGGRLRSDTEIIDREISAADAILVGHSHFDHVLDVPYIARRTGAKVFGSRSTAHLMAAAGLPAEQIVPFEPGRTSEFECGPFRIDAVPSLHSTFLFGRVPSPGDIPCTCELPISAGAYRCGEVYNFAIRAGTSTLYHMGSANLVDEVVPTRSGVDVLLMCIAARFATPDFVSRALRAVQPRVVMPMHYDNFLRRLDEPMRVLPRTRFGPLIDEIESFDRQMGIRTLSLGGRVDLR